jgi:hypothetical protein
MGGTNEIRYVKGSDIDRDKWDRCIRDATNGLIYSYSYYLDIMADNWDALIIGDHQIVMPLPWRSKYGIRYVYQPFLTAQLGIFGNGLTGEIVNNMIDAIPSSFKLVECSLNQGNFAPVTALKRSNYVLDLSASYEELYTNYRENIQRNIKKAFQLGCTAKISIEVEEVIKLALAQMRSNDKDADENAGKFRRLYSILEQKQMAATYGILSDKGEIISSAVFFYSHGRAYYILVGNHPNGRTIGASHALIDAFIKDHAGQKLLLDFEGSDFRNLAFFYSSFGAKLETYPALKLNRLPFYLKWLKR